MILRRFDEIDGVVVVLFDASRNRQDVGIEDDVVRIEPGLLGQQLVGALADRRPSAAIVSAWPTSSNAITTTPAP